MFFFANQNEKCGLEVVQRREVHTAETHAGVTLPGHKPIGPRQRHSQSLAAAAAERRRGKDSGETQMATLSNTDSEEIPQKRPRENDKKDLTTSAEKNNSANGGSSESAKTTAVSHRAPFDATHRINRLGGKYHVLLAVTGSVASIKVNELIAELYKQSPENRLAIKVVATQSALNFFDAADTQEIVYDDRDEWNMWKKRGDPVLHIELRKWADSMLIAPLDANSLAKIANGICDNLVTSVVRAWDQRKPLYFAPAMNTAMWENPLTYQHLKTLKELLLYREIPPIEKEMMCGDKGYGAMASVQMIASIISSDIKNKYAVYSYSSENASS
ncbi:hypothetical protein niasHS_010932 [Heterodera schachtii]|uniref:Phosphopantothenoylcysteine decarboxylase n=1 Tax=Heterodera schachtii TaxID=97005 RepID=A0ABD2J0L5_HETSC